MPRPAALVATASVLAAVVLIAVVWFTRDETATVTGIVIGADGQPVPGARVVDAATGAAEVADDAGRFELDVPESGSWLTAAAEDHLPRTRAARPGREVVIRLAEDTPGTVTMAFGGDVMFGRRYYDPDEDGDTADGLLQPGASPAEHEELLSGIAPLLDVADLTIVNLESPLAPDPYFDPGEPRPVTFNRDKGIVFASSPAAAEAMVDVGADVVALGNNHIYDRLDEGLTSTLEALDAAGLGDGAGRFGAGLDVDDAWLPAVRTVDGQRIGFIGCTTVIGSGQEFSNVAEADKGGAAACDEGRLAEEIAELDDRADTVVVMIHGGTEYETEPSAPALRMTEAATEAGADLVINHHPHVVGGLSVRPDVLVASSLGNLLFDQRVWPTFASYVLFTAVRDGIVRSAWIEPIRLESFQPVGVVGEHADWVSRGALTVSDGGWIVEDGSLWWDAHDVGDPEQSEVPLPAGNDLVGRIDRGCVLASPEVRPGRDLLWTGDFEELSIGPRQGAALWNVDDGLRDRAVAEEAAFRGDRGVRLRRSGGRRRDVVLTTTNRVPVDPGTSLTALFWYRPSSSPGDASLQLSWYNGLSGPSEVQTIVPIETEGVEGWQLFRLDVEVPANAVAVQPFIRLAPPGPALSILDVDEVRMIAWDDPAGCAYLWSEGAESVTVRNTGALGGEAPTLELLDVAPFTEEVEDLPPPPPDPLS